MIISERILQLLKNQKVTKRKIYTEVGITAQTLDDKLKKDYFLIGELQIISGILGVSVSYLISENEEKNLSIGDNNNLAIGKHANITLDACRAENEHLKKELLKAKDEIIELLKSKNQ